MAEKHSFDNPSPSRTQDFTKNLENIRTSAQIQCPACGLVVASDTRFCPNDATPLQSGRETKTVTNYQFIRLIGEGGMANVYEAEHVVLKKRVAIKVLKAHLNETSAFMRFQREAQTASRIRHPNIVGVYDCGMSELGEPYMVMDLVAGETLDKRLKNGPLAIDESLEIMKMVCAGVSCAHENGVLHRDLKPSNIILEQQGSGSIARVLDFGIAKIVQDTDNAAMKTRTGELFGTPTYMSPEQIGGETLDQRSDVFALGCILYELLTGQPPVVGNSLMEIMFKQVNETPCSMSEASLGRKFPKQLENLVFRAIAKEPSSRFASAKRMLVAIENFQAGKSDDADESVQPDNLNLAKYPSIAKKVNQQNQQRLEKQDGSQRVIKASLISLGAVALITLCVVIISSVMKSDTATKVYDAAPAVESKTGFTPTVLPPVDAESLGADAQFRNAFRHLSNRTFITLPAECSDGSLDLIAQCPQLTELSLKECDRITVGGFKKVSSLPKLEKLSLAGTKINTEEAMQLISRMPRLIELDLSDVLTGDKNGKENTSEWDKILLKLTGPETLFSLTLKDSDIDKEGLKNLPMLKNLDKLELDRCPWITDEAVAELSKMHALTRLKLNHCSKLTNAVGKALAKIKTLKRLEISDTAADEKTLRDISGMNLKWVDIRDCSSISTAAALKYEKEHGIDSIFFEKMKKSKPMKAINIPGF